MGSTPGEEFEPVMAKVRTLYAGLELDKLSGVGSENRVTCSRETLTTLNLGKSFHGVQLPRGTLT